MPSRCVSRPLSARRRPRRSRGLSRTLLAVAAILLVACLRYVAIDVIRLTGTQREVVVGVLAVLAHAALIWLIFLLAARSADAVIRMRDMGAYALDAQLVRLVSKLVAALLTIYALVNLAESLGVSVAPMLAGLGVGGLAVALAVRPTLENIVAGFVLFADAPVRVGEFCQFGDKMGTVEAIGLRSVRVRGLDRTVITVPNAEFCQLQLVNFTRRDAILLHARLQLRYETTPDQLRLVLARLRELLIRHPRVSPDPARVRFVGYGASSLDLEIFAFVETRDFSEFLAIQEDLNLRIKDIVAACGAEFAFPSQTLYLERSHGLDAALTKAAETEVARWRSENRLPFPDYDEATRRELSNNLDYPPEGSPGRPASR
ncbi:MAG: mechanosensitive ion channel family protein [Burkholderiales bacterium]|nr:mechanosensitive ion channel family protein [Burkholderiales bacterium]